MPASKWETEHSCLSAYFVAAQASSTKANIYDNALYSMPDDDPTGPRKARMIGPFNIDVFEYPPQFLLLPRALQLLTPDIIAVSMLAMVLFERRRWAAGGALLAFATVSKLYPGLLIVYLIARRQWRAVAWTSAFAAAFSLVTLWMLGSGQYAAFVEHLPGLVGGEAFPAFRRPAAVAINYSIPGLVFKLGLFGVPGMSFAASKIVGWGYTLVAVAATVFVGLRTLRDREKPLVWMAILILATLRSPFLPQAYAAVPPLWLLTLLAATRAPIARTPLVIVLAWAALNAYWPTDWPMDPRLLAVVIAVPQAVTVAIVVFAMRGSAQVPALRAVPVG